MFGGSSLRLIMLHEAPGLVLNTFLLIKSLMLMLLLINKIRFLGLILCLP